MVTTSKGDLIDLALQGKFDIIAQGCNCFCKQGKGLAKQIKEIFPEAYQADLETKKGDKEKMGNFSFAMISLPKKTIIVANLYTQYFWGEANPEKGETQKERYQAIEESLLQLNSKFPNKKIGLPYIGAGLAGGNWNIISKTINQIG